MNFVRFRWKMVENFLSLRYYRLQIAVQAHSRAFHGWVGEWGRSHLMKWTRRDWARVWEPRMWGYISSHYAYILIRDKSQGTIPLLHQHRRSDDLRPRRAWPRHCWMLSVHSNNDVGLNTPATPHWTTSVTQILAFALWIISGPPLSLL